MGREGHFKMNVSKVMKAHWSDMGRKMLLVEM